MLITHCTCCSEETEHDVLRESKSGILICCTSCGAVQSTPRQGGRNIDLKAIVSSEGESKVCVLEVSPDEELHVGNIVVAECGKEAFGVAITSIEHQGKRVQQARADQIDTLWTRVVDRVVVKASVHEGRNTVPICCECEGSVEFTVGESYDFGKKRFHVSHIKLRDGGLLRRNGQSAPAQNVKRIYGYRL
jgi:uncharacterized Zn finger protein